MNADDLFQSFGGISDEVINESESRPRTKRRVFLWAAAAMLLAVCCAMPFVLRGGHIEDGSGGNAAEARNSAAPTRAPRATEPPHEPEQHAEGSYVENYGFDLVMDNSPFVFECKCLSVTAAYSFNTDLELELTNVIRGELSEGDIIPARTVFGEHYTVGGKYLVFARPIASVFENKPLMYSIDAVVYGSYKNDMPDIAGMSYGEIVALAEKYAAERPYEWDGHVIGEYCASEDIAEICAFSDCVLRVRVNELLFSPLEDRMNYSCTVLKAYSGSAGQKITVISFPDSMEIGKEYIVMLMNPDGGLVYAVSSLKSVIPAGSADAGMIEDIFG